MSETQNIEYKSSWHDDHLKWICGFANATGGIIFIGKNDKGEVVGVSDHKKLMDDIPNKIKNYLGIIAEVNLNNEEGKYFIEIITPPYTGSCFIKRSVLPAKWKHQYRIGRKCTD